MATEKRLIDADALLAKFKKHRDLYAPSWESFKNSSFDVKARVDEIDTCMADVINAPTVDAVEVVRCKDCVWCHKIEDLNYCENPNTPWIDDPDFDDITVADNDYCSYGERKDNED